MKKDMLIFIASTLILATVYTTGIALAMLYAWNLVIAPTFGFGLLVLWQTYLLQIAIFVITFLSTMFLSLEYTIVSRISSYWIGKTAKKVAEQDVFNKHFGGKNER
jgi:hypothetical protein